LREKLAVYVLTDEAIRCCRPAAPVALPAICFMTIARLGLVALLASAGALAAQGDLLPLPTARQTVFGSAGPKASTASASMASASMAFRPGVAFRPRAARIALARQVRRDRQALARLTGDLPMLTFAAVQSAKTSAEMSAKAAGKTNPETSAEAAGKAAGKGADKGAGKGAGKTFGNANVGRGVAAAPVALAKLANAITSPQPHRGDDIAAWREETFARPTVVDGRTLGLGPVTVRLAGIVLPAADETCRLLDGSTAPCAARSATQMELMLRWRPVTCRLPDGPRGDISTRCRIGATDLAEWLVRNGWARPAQDAPAHLAAAARAAQQQKAGLWREPAPQSAPPPAAAALPKWTAAAL
jgi:endonuclease YncB( thermonuclease family)